MRLLKDNLGIILIIVGVIGFIYFNNFQDNNNQDYSENEEFVNYEETSDLTVEIKGEVINPGIYTVEDGFRVVELINLAGGLTENADIASLNRAKKIVDEMIIEIPKKTSEEITENIVIKKITVEIRGEVKYPGVYDLNENSIVNDLIQIAGGFTAAADLDEVNLAKKLTTGQQIIIPTLKLDSEEKIYVEIKGEIINPGVYKLNKGSIVLDLIELAGGLTTNANIESISQVELLNNHQVIVIPSIVEINEQIAVDIKGEVNCPGVYYFNESVRFIDVINAAGGFTKNANYQEINLSKKIADEELIIVEENTSETNLIAIDLKGEVKYPGVYYLEKGSRIGDAIELAGGFKPKADREQINLADLLEDEQKIIVPKIIDNNDYIYVQISGEVMYPGIYALLPDSRLIMLINKAGGFTNKAKTENLNLTKTLQDEEMINIPSIEDDENNIYISITGEVKSPGTYYVNSNITILEAINIAGGLTLNADVENIDYNQSIELGTNIFIPSINISQLPNEVNGLININTADVETLQNLTGIGVILAERIIEYRNNNDGFKSIEEIMNVSGIKNSIYEQIKDNITV
ncbi:MAG: SLBB domain-containing protein [Bacillota bacterium]